MKQITLRQLKVKQKGTLNIFKKNFFKSFDQLGKLKINNYEDFYDKSDFGNFNDEQYKKQYIDVHEKHNFCIIDGNKYKISGLNIPFGIFNGRGNNGKIGCIRKDIIPEDVTVNTTNKNISVPWQYKGHAWKQVISDSMKTFLACWKDDITNKVIYMRPERSSPSTQNNNKKKFDLARLVGQNINQIQKKIQLLRKSSDEVDLQMYVCIYFIYNFGLRAGSHDLDNDVIGAAQLKIKNVQIINQNKLRLIFTGKDSILYDQTHNISEDISALIEMLISGKQKNDEIFDKITSSKVNSFLNQIMTGLTSKTFRTYRSSQLLYERIQHIYKKYKPSQYQQEFLVEILKQEMFIIAKFCNHVKTTQDKKRKKKQQQLLQKIKKLEKTIKKQKKSKDKNEEIINKNQQKLQILIEKLKYYNHDMDLSLTTSKQNYIDPRIIISYCEHYGIDVLKIYTLKEMENIQWAFYGTGSDFIYT